MPDGDVSRESLFSCYFSLRGISFLRYFWLVIFFILRKLAVPLGENVAVIHGGDTGI